jgi:hypothetical protein
MNVYALTQTCRILKIIASPVYKASGAGAEAERVPVSANIPLPLA